MATINITDNVAGVEKKYHSDEEQLMFSNMSQPRRIEQALEIIEELREEHNKFHVLVSKIVDDLTPVAGHDATEYQAWKLAQILEDMMGDISQSLRLKKCIKTMQQL